MTQDIEAKIRADKAAEERKMAVVRAARVKEVRVNKDTDKVDAAVGTGREAVAAVKAGMGTVATVGKDADLKTKILLIAAGIFIGAINGFFGGGGGLVCVPVLGGILGLSAKQSHATAILVILPLSVVSAAVYAFSGSWRWGSGLPAALGVVVGGVLGALLLKKLSNNVVSIIFAAVMIFAGVRMFF